MTFPLCLQNDEPLAPKCTLELGGRARAFVDASDRETLVQALSWSERENLPCFVLGGGSNIVIADDGFPGLVIRASWKGLHVEESLDAALLTVQAGESWDALVAMTVDHQWAGLECLSGIPGLVGATPIQNVGAYGQEVSDTIVAVEVFDRGEGRSYSITPDACQFQYRSSVFKRVPGRFVILSVTFRLSKRAKPSIRYPELARTLSSRRAAPSLDDVRHAVIELRRAKSMVLDSADENGRSVGSFFHNPIVSEAELRQIERHALEMGIVDTPESVPRFAHGEQFKVPAAWLIETSGTRKGERHGGVGISTKHALALVHLGGAKTADLIALARLVRERVESYWSVRLSAEPSFIGFSKDPFSSVS